MSDKIAINDNRTGNSYELPVVEGTIKALDLRQLKTSEDDFGLMTYDPGFKNTASCRSRITYIDGERGILRYRGYPIEQLAMSSNHLETSYLLIHGQLPSRHELDHWVDRVKRHSMLHENIKHFMQGFRYDAHPMGILISTVAALSTFYPESKDLDDPDSVKQQTYRLIGKMPTIAAYSLRHRLGWPYVAPDEELSYTGNFLYMLWRRGEKRTAVPAALEKALDVIFLLHADHEQNCSTTVMRSVASSLGDPYSATAAAAAALYGPRHGGANERVLEQLKKIGSKDNVPALLGRVKTGEERLMGFGHRVYHNYDPRANILKEIAQEVFAETGSSPLLDVALELERIALEDDYFVGRNLYPNVDFYSGIILDAMDFPADEFTVLFAIARTVGWIAQYREFLEDSEQSIARPRQIYEGEHERQYIGVGDR
jgi:citrate synthase